MFLFRSKQLIAINWYMVKHHGLKHFSMRGKYFSVIYPISLPIPWLTSDCNYILILIASDFLFNHLHHPLKSYLKSQITLCMMNFQLKNNYDFNLILRQWNIFNEQGKNHFCYVTMFNTEVYWLIVSLTLRECYFFESKMAL